MGLCLSWVGELIGLCSPTSASPWAREAAGISSSSCSRGASSVGSSGLAAPHPSGCYLSQPARSGPSTRAFPPWGTDLFARPLLTELVGYLLISEILSLCHNPFIRPVCVTAFVTDKKQACRQTLSSHMLHPLKWKPVLIHQQNQLFSWIANLVITRCRSTQPLKQDGAFFHHFLAKLYCQKSKKGAGFCLGKGTVHGVKLP